MSDQEFLDILNRKAETNAPAFIIYSPAGSQRLNYVCDFIFRQVLQVNVTITSSIEVFLSSPLFRINYSDEKIDYSFQVTPCGLLSENKITAAKPSAEGSGGSLVFYPVKSGDLRFDIFSAVFYMISRYEEWQSYQPDEHGRFELDQSVLFKHGSHLFPICDEWISVFKDRLEKHFSALSFPRAAFQSIATIDVDNLYAYKHKGLFRTTGAALRDLLKLNFAESKRRLSVLAGTRKDPFDVYEDIKTSCRSNKIPLLFFFLVRSGTRYDRTVKDKKAFGPVVSQLRDPGVHCGIHPSYFAQQHADLFKDEVKFLSRTLDSQINFSRQHYLRFNIKTTPHLIMENKISADFSMGFASGAGFRAGTSFPFNYYDFSKEQKAPLLFVPFCAMDGAYFIYSKREVSSAKKELLELKDKVKKHNGFYVTVFHERTFAEHLYPGYGNLFKELLAD